MRNDLVNECLLAMFGLMEVDEMEWNGTEYNRMERNGME